MPSFSWRKSAVQIDCSHGSVPSAMRNHALLRCNVGYVEGSLRPCSTSPAATLALSGGGLLAIAVALDLRPWWLLEWGSSFGRATAASHLELASVYL